MIITTYDLPNHHTCNCTAFQLNPYTYSHQQWGHICVNKTCSTNIITDSINITWTPHIMRINTSRTIYFTIVTSFANITISKQKYDDDDWNSKACKDFFIHIYGTVPQLDVTGVSGVCVFLPHNVTSFPCDSSSVTEAWGGRSKLYPRPSTRDSRSRLKASLHM